MAAHDGRNPQTGAAEIIAEASGNEKAQAAINKPDRHTCSGCGVTFNQNSSSDSRVDWSQGNKKFFSAETLQKVYEALTKKSDTAASRQIEISILESEVRTRALQLFQVGGELGQALAARRVVQQKIFEAQNQATDLLVHAETVQSIVDGPQTFPSVENQYAIADAAFKRAAFAVDRAGEYFFLLRRGVERDLVPGNPADGTSKLTGYENAQLGTFPDCVSTHVTQSSLDINFSTLPCFRQRVDLLQKALEASRANRSASFLDLADTTVPFSAWVRDSANRQYTIDLTIALDAAQRRGKQSGQKLHDIHFYLDTNDPTPLAVHVQVTRSSEDSYWLGERTPPGTGILEPVFQNFTFTRGPSQGPSSAFQAEDILFELLRDNTAYRREAFACNGLRPTDPISPEHAKCFLSTLGTDGQAFVFGHSLLGKVTLTLSDDDLGTRVPRSLFADVKYEYRVNPDGL